MGPRVLFLRRAYQPRLKQRSAGTCSILVWSISASIASLGPAHGSLHFPTLLRPTSQPPCSAGASAVVSACPSGPTTPTAHLSGHVMDEWSDHALASRCGGDRVTRDNLIRDVVHSAANDRANLGTVVEKPGLLIPRNPVDDDRSPDPDPRDPGTASRRPADVWVTRGRPGGAPEAWDFSITSASRMGPALADPTAIAGVFASVESRKNTFLNTAAQCTQAGFTFCPLVLWEVGGWSDALRSVVAWIARPNDLDPQTSLTPASRLRTASRAPFRGKRARDLEACTRANGFSLSVPGACQFWPSPNSCDVPAASLSCKFHCSRRLRIPRRVTLTSARTCTPFQ